MPVNNRPLGAALGAALLLSTAPAFAAADPRGVWIDHTGRGAVEIADCGGGLCGRVVWLKDAANAAACGVQILGDVKPTGPGVWDKGWIYDPERDAKFSVELKPLAGEKLRVLGYLGTKLFSETMTWQRAPAGLAPCGGSPGVSAAKPATAGDPPADGAKAAEAAPQLVQPARPAPREPTASDRVAEVQPASPPATPEVGAAQRGATGPQAPAKAAPRECKLEISFVAFTFPCPD